MNLVEFIFAFSAVFGSTLIHYLWIRFVYKIEKSEPNSFDDSKVVNS